MMLVFLNCILFLAALIYALSAWEYLVDNDCNDSTKVERGNTRERVFWKTLFNSFFCCYLFKCKFFRKKKSPKSDKYSVALVDS